jgi:uncharacterized membrane protein YcfT
LLNLAALGIVAIRFGPPLLARLPRPRWLEDMGSASLPVFCAHLVAVFVVVSLTGGGYAALPYGADLLILGAVFVVLYAVARAVLRWEAGRGGAGKKPIARAGGAQAH